MCQGYIEMKYEWAQGDTNMCHEVLRMRLTTGYRAVLCGCLAGP